MEILVGVEEPQNFLRDAVGESRRGDLDPAPLTGRQLSLSEQRALLLLGRYARWVDLAGEISPCEVRKEGNEDARHPVASFEIGPRAGESRSDHLGFSSPGRTIIDVLCRIGDEQHLSVRFADQKTKKVPPFEAEVLSFVDEDDVEPREERACFPALVDPFRLSEQPVESATAIVVFAVEDDGSNTRSIDDIETEPMKVGRQDPTVIRTDVPTVSGGEILDEMRQRDVETQDEYGLPLLRELGSPRRQSESLSASCGPADAAELCAIWVAGDVAGGFAQNQGMSPVRDPFGFAEVAAESRDVLRTHPEIWRLFSTAGPEHDLPHVVLALEAVSAIHTNVTLRILVE
ncbi:MAG: hypothetical protein M5U32_19115 [Myxococcota bacterium]|nr:hypothetical protein [Myxococcota bacterium]